MERPKKFEISTNHSSSTCERPHQNKQRYHKRDFQLPDQTPKRGRGHFFEPTSFQKPSRPTVQKVPPIEHWHLRESKIRTMEFKPIQNPQRREMRHNNYLTRNPESSRPQSLRTFYFANYKTDKQFSIEDRMQRKSRIDQVELRKSFYKDLDIFKRN